MAMNSKPKLSILIVSWNAWHHLERCLDSLLASNFQGFKILVFDNGSTDGTAAQVASAYPQVDLVASAANLGLPGAVNRAIPQLDSEYVMLLDADTQIEPNTLGMLLEFMDSNPQVSLAAPRIMTPEGQIEESARNLPSIMSGIFGRRSVLTRLFPNNRFSARYLARNQLNSAEPFRVEQISASSMFMRRSVFDEVGPWDEEYRCYWVDTDWCSRLQKLDKQIYCVPEARIVHHENNRVGIRKSPWRIWQFHMGALRLFGKQLKLGVFDPRYWLAAALLTTRAVVLLGQNALKSKEAAADKNPSTAGYQVDPTGSDLSAT